MKRESKYLLFVIIGTGLCGAVFASALLNSTLRAPQKGVWVIQPFFAYNLTRGDGGKNHTVEGQQVLRIFPVGDGRRFNLYGNVNYSLASDEPYSVDKATKYVIEGIQTYQYSTGDRFVWIKVDRMYNLKICLDENGYIKQIPYKGELPK